MSAPDLLIVGEAFEELIFVGLDRLPSLGEKVKTSVFFRSIGGGSVITAVAAARLVDPDPSGERPEPRRGGALASRARAGGEPAPRRRPHAITASMSTRSNRAFVTFNGVNDALEERLPAALDGARTRHAHFAFFPRDCGRWERLVGVLRARGIGTSWDFGWSEALLADRRFPYLVNALDWVFFNEQEAVLYARRLHLDAALAMGATVAISTDGTSPAAPFDLFQAARKTQLIHSFMSQDGYNGVAGPRSVDGFSIFEADNNAMRSLGATPQSWVTAPQPTITGNAMSFTLWIYPDGVPADWTGFLMNRSGTGLGVGLGGDLGGGVSSHNMLAYTWNDNSTWNFVSGLTLPISQWSFAAVTIEPSKAILYLINTNGTRTATNAIPYLAEG